jgi:hypothetical protein
MGDRGDNRKVGSKDKPEERLVAETRPKKSALRDETKLPMGIGRADPQDSQFLDPFQSSQEVAMANQHGEEVYPGGASIGVEYKKPRRATFAQFSVREMVRDPDTGKITAVVYTQEQLNSLRQERKEIIDYLRTQIHELKDRSVLTRTGKASLEDYKRKVKNLKGTFFERDPSADYEYTPEYFSKKVKAYLEDLIESYEEYIKLCKELLPEDDSQSASIQIAQSKLKSTLETLIEKLIKLRDNDPDSEQVEELNERIANCQAKLQQLEGEEEGKAGGGSAAKEEDLGGRKKPKRRTIKHKLTRRSKTRKLKNKRESKGKTSKRRSKRSRRR